MSFKLKVIAAAISGAMIAPVHAATDQNIIDLFDWAEQQFSEFPDSDAALQEASGYKYRYYPSVDAYLGYNPTTNQVATLGLYGDTITDHGDADQYFAQAGITVDNAGDITLDGNGKLLTVGAQRNITTGAFTESMINSDNTLSSSAWTYGWTVNIHGNADIWTTDAAADDSCPTGTTDTGTDLKGLDACELPSTISDDLTLTKDNVYVLANGGTKVGDGNAEDGGTISGKTLTIEPGTLIVGSETDYLLITRGNKIDAQGTATSPIVFRSTGWAETGEEYRQSWGGVVLQGNAYDFKGTQVLGEGGVGYYGGTNNEDNSGVMKYVVITGAGYDIDGNGNELNALTLQGVGSATDISYIQIDESHDDGIEFFGGTASVDHLALTDIGDDAFDVDQGWKGSAENIFISMSKTYSAGGPGESRGIEADGHDPKDADGNKYINADTSAEEATVMTLSNFTIVGSDKSDSGLVLRRGVSGTFNNFNVSGFVADSGMEIRDRGTIEDGVITNADTGETTWSGTYERLTFTDSEFANNGGSVKLSMNKDEVEHPANILSDAEADTALSTWMTDQEANNVDFGE
ncbi:hypothetical protein [Thiomicrospira sp. WB1]|uniref:hypothetical protein n=1 Tax=Thiomicrospira sp. WB1 TaxID=1685380 RepID=UPI0007468520|nr:hypothetical protein [Thiomicrospira sp. WB1]KUJ72438.1 hypothetical protein AVO41_01075 [Thiomicrospira sp. WB1]